MNAKKEFELIGGFDQPSGIKVRIIGKEPMNKPYVSVQIPLLNEAFFIADEDLEKFAINILKALKSKYLK